MRFFRCALVWMALFALFLSCVPPALCQRKTAMDKKCDQESEKGTIRCLEWRAINILARSGGAEDEIKKAINILNQARAMDPLDLGILSNLVSCYVMMKNYETALKYVNDILEINPGLIEAKFYKCLLLERLNHPQNECKACYRSVAAWYRDRARTKDVSYVYARLMLGGTGAEKVKNEYLASLKPGSEQYKMWY